MPCFFGAGVCLVHSRMQFVQLHLSGNTSSPSSSSSSGGNPTPQSPSPAKEGPAEPTRRLTLERGCADLGPSMTWPSHGGRPPTSPVTHYFSESKSLKSASGKPPAFFSSAPTGPGKRAPRRQRRLGNLKGDPHWQHVDRPVVPART